MSLRTCRVSDQPPVDRLTLTAAISNSCFGFLFTVGKRDEALAETKEIAVAGAPLLA